MKVGFYSNLTIRHNGSTQLRCLQPAQYLRSKGYDVRVKRIHQSIPRKGEIVVLHRAFYNEYTEAFINAAKAQGSPVLYDTDDLLFEPAGSDYLVRIGKKNYKDYASALKAMQACDHVIVSTDFLAQRARKHLSKVSTILNGLSTDFIRNGNAIHKQRQSLNKDFITMAYLCGSSTHNGDFKIVEEALLKSLKDNPRLQLLLVGPLKFSKKFYRFGRQFLHRDFIPYAEYTKIFEQIDLNLVPLEQQEMFCQAKSELKFIEAGICGVPSLATPTDPHKKAIRDGLNSAFADDHEWEQKIKELCASPQQLRAMGEQARQTVLEFYTPEKRAEEWSQLFERLAQDTWTSASPLHPANGKMLLRYSLQGIKRELRKIKNG